MHKQTRQTPEQKYQLQALYNKGFPQYQIAESLGVHASTVSRELKRNANNKQYCANSAEILKNNRKKTALKFKKHHPRHENILSERLSMGWSPENIHYQMRLACPEIALSHSTLYRHIREDRDAGVRFGKTRWKGGKRQAGQSRRIGWIPVNVLFLWINVHVPTILKGIRYTVKMLIWSHWLIEKADYY
ncbi:helix-turn-helix domain-containing protein [Xenorhabdus bovienii]|uniref:helix-turn-helix domain-containing protein n=1 Tax=Xenorhabdus bovienii TaxID=40576 RepID=UPI0023B30F0D|nr:helix-turn-helix domain-containing protein [Xenorhabdus bovienii]MDE9566376.1 helix-turn-helix domain-containing protein [Xenorhabdus bovienii]